MSVIISKDSFERRIKKLYNSWREHRADIWDNSNVLAIMAGSASDDLRYLKSVSLHLWLFGYEVTDTLLVFTDKTLYVMTTSKKANLLEPLTATLQAAAGVELKITVRTKGSEQEQLNELLGAIKAAEPEPRVGHLPKEQPTGSLAEMWLSTLQASGITLADAAAGFADLFSVKEDSEVLNAKKAAFLASKVMQSWVVEKIEDIIDKNKKVKHSKLSELTEEVILNPPKIDIKLKPENVDIAYPPLFQSGGRFDLKLNAVTDDNALHGGVIVVALGTRYQNYCANVSRTYIINSSKTQEAQYTALLKAQEAAIGALKEGTPAKAAMEAAVKSLQDSGHPELVERLNKTIGFGMGLEFREGSNLLNAKNDKPLKAGQVFAVTLGVTGLEAPDAADSKDKVYALQISDTVVIKPGGAAADNMCSQATKLWDRVSYVIDEQEDDGPDALEEVTNNNMLPTGKKLRSDDPNHKSSEQIRREKQEQMLKQVNESTLHRLTAGQNGANGNEAAAKGRLISQVQAYRNLTDVPQTRDLQVMVDSRAESVLVPIYGVMVPLHITTVRNVNHTAEQESSAAIIRISLNFG